MADIDTTPVLTVDDLVRKYGYRTIPLLVERLTARAVDRASTYNAQDARLLVEVRAAMADLETALKAFAAGGRSTALGMLVDVASSYVEGRRSAEEAVDSVVDVLAQAGLLGDVG